MSNDFGGLNPDFSSGLQMLIAASGGRIWVNSGYRSPERQAQLYEQGKREHGADVNKWVAPPGKSNHNHGLAADLGGDLNLAHQLAARFGLSFPMGHEPWHIEPQGIRQMMKGGDPTQGYTQPPDGSPLDTSPDSQFGDVGTQMYVLTALLRGTDPSELRGQFAMGAAPEEIGAPSTEPGMAGGGTGEVANTGKWAVDFLNAAGITPNNANVAFVNAWMRAESGNNPGSGEGGGRFNPLNTTQGGYLGETKYNQVGVKNYTSYEDGIKANVHALQNGRYNHIIEAMRGSDPMRMAQALTNSPWGTGGLVTKILQDQDPNSWAGAYAGPGSAQQVGEEPAPTTTSYQNPQGPYNERYGRRIVRI